MNELEREARKRTQKALYGRILNNRDYNTQKLLDLPGPSRTQILTIELTEPNWPIIDLRNRKVKLAILPEKPNK